jgi:hypothetical protein
LTLFVDRSGASRVPFPTKGDDIMFKTATLSAAVLLAAASPALAQSGADAIAGRAPIIEALPDVAKEPLSPVKEFVAARLPVSFSPRICLASPFTQAARRSAPSTTS